jgi:putative ABC transport system permease protein
MARLMTVSLTPWRRGPLLLLRRPGVFLAIAAAAFVAALPAASAPLFLSSARNATLHNQLAIGCPWTAGAATSTALRRYGPNHEILGSTEDAVRRRAEIATANTPAGLSPPMATLRGLEPMKLSVPGRAGADAQANLVARDDFVTHVEVRAGGPGPGLWLPHGLAETLGVQPGQRLDLTEFRPRNQFTVDRFGREIPAKTTSLPVTAIYTDLRTLPDDPYWCGVREVYRGFPGQEYSNVSLFDMVLLDTATFAGLDAEVQTFGAYTVEWSVAAPQTMRYEDARQLEIEITGLADRLSDSGYFDEMVRRFTATGSPVHGVDTRFAAVTRRAGFVHDGLKPPVVPITAAGIVVGLLVVGAAAVFWVQRRQRELAVLAAHGVSPADLGLKAILESLPALVVGTAAGGVAGWALVRAIGPDPVLSADAPALAAIGAAATLVVATAVIWFAAALRTRSLTDQSGSRHAAGRWARLPWELLLFAAAALAWRSLGGSGQFTDASGAGTIAIVPARLLVAPILVVAGLVILGGRIGVRVARRRRLRAAISPATLLARRRLVRHATIAAVLAGATAIPVALATYGAIVTNTVQSTVEGEARLQVGSDLVVTLSKPAAIPPSLADRATEVTRLSQVSVDGTRADILAVDPGTFTKGAFWHRGMDGPSLSDLEDRLDGTTAIGDTVVRAGTAGVTWGGDPIGDLTIERVRVLPGPRGGFPVVLADRSAFSAETLAEGNPEIWVRGDAQSALRALAQADAPVIRYLAAEERYADTTFEPLTFTFTYLAALSLLTGLVSLVGLLLYLESRTPTMRRGYVLLRRMGLRTGAHRHALFRELGVPLALGLIGGLAMVAGLTAAVRSQLELEPNIPPGPLLDLPLAEVAGTAAAVFVVAILATLFAQARTGRAKPSEVLRDAN